MWTRGLDREPSADLIRWTGMSRLDDHEMAHRAADRIRELVMSMMEPPGPTLPGFGHLQCPTCIEARLRRAESDGEGKDRPDPVVDC